MRFIMKLLVVLSLLIVVLLGCSSQTCVMSQQARGIGIRASYSAQTQLPEFWFGYIGQSLVLVPTNREADTTSEGYRGGAGDKGGAKDTTDVLTDFSIRNFFAFWEGQGIYERVAVGKNAVEAAKYMMLRDGNGQIDANTIDAVNKLQTNDQKMEELLSRVNAQIPPASIGADSVLNLMKINIPEVK